MLALLTPVVGDSSSCEEQPVQAAALLQHTGPAHHGGADPEAGNGTRVSEDEDTDLGMKHAKFQSYKSVPKCHVRVFFLSISVQHHCRGNAVACPGFYESALEEFAHHSSIELVEEREDESEEEGTEIFDCRRRRRRRRRQTNTLNKKCWYQMWSDSMYEGWKGHSNPFCRLAKELSEEKHGKHGKQQLLHVQQCSTATFCRRLVEL